VGYSNLWPGLRTTEIGRPTAGYDLPTEGRPTTQELQCGSPLGGQPGQQPNRRAVGCSNERRNQVVDTTTSPRRAEERIPVHDVPGLAG
jgi:hypothetical protein